jgi:tRNA dimethylallyltransferase
MSATSVLIISGPTASGKSDLAINLAEKLDGQIINCDSVQLYRECDIGSAKPNELERARVKHHLFDILAPDEQCDVGLYSAWAHEKIIDVQKDNALPILVGSSGLYISTLLEGIDPMPKGDPDLRLELSQYPTNELYSQLKQIDPKRAEQLKCGDRGRIIRALEVWKTSGIKQSEWFKQAKIAGKTHMLNNDSNFNVIILVLWPDRTQLYDTIKNRVALMLKRGLIDETKMLLQKYGDKIAPLKAIGYRETVEAISRSSNTEQTGEQQESELAQLIEKISQNTRRYSKRQYTYWRNEPLKRGWAPFLSWISTGSRSNPQGITELAKLIYSRFGVLRCKDGKKVEIWYLKS